MPEIGREGQLRLKSFSALVVGAGGLGSAAAMYLTAAGVGRLGIADFDVVEPDNVQRQLLHWTDDVGRAKLDSAAEKLSRINPAVELVRHRERLTGQNAVGIARAYDAVVDATDNFEARYLLSEACVSLGLPHVFGAVLRFEGRVSVFDAATGPCYRCLHPEEPPAAAIPDCAEAGVLSPLPGVVGALQAAEAIKIAAGCGTPLVGRLLVIDALSMRFRTLEVRKDPECRTCGRG